MHVFPDRVLDVMFTYQPTNDDTRPRYAATAKARADYDAAIIAVFEDLATSEASTPHTDYVALHARVSAAARTYAGVVNDVCADPKDMNSHVQSAIMSITVSRMWANKAIRAPLGPVRGRLMALARTESEEAEMLANAAIALAEPVAAAYDAIPE